MDPRTAPAMAPITPPATEELLLQRVIALFADCPGNRVVRARWVVTAKSSVLTGLWN